MLDLEERIQVASNGELKDLNAIAATIKFISSIKMAFKENKSFNKDIIITGNEVERIHYVKMLAKLLKEDNILKSDEVIIVNKESLFSSNGSEASKNLSAAIKESRGKILYIENVNEFSIEKKSKGIEKEIVDVIRDQLDKNEKDVFMILGGPSEELDNFFYYAPCIRVRIAHIIKL